MLINLNVIINIDYRFQYVPKWNLDSKVKLAISHSVLRHSYVGKSSNTELAYELKSNFIGAGLVFGEDNFWLELFIVKAYSGETKSSEVTKKSNTGIRFDSELVYPISEYLRIIPGINYYQVKESSLNYQLSVYEARFVIAREFEF